MITAPVNRMRLTAVEPIRLPAAVKNIAVHDQRKAVASAAISPG